MRTILEFIRDFFIGTRYISFCESQIKQQREDFLERLREKDAEIRRLRVEFATRGDRLNANAVAVAPTPAPPAPIEVASGPLDWQGELSKMLLEEEESTDGIRSE